MILRAARKLSVMKIRSGTRGTIISTAAEVATLKLSVVNFNELGFARLAHARDSSRVCVCAGISKRLLLETGKLGVADVPR